VTDVSEGAADGRPPQGAILRVAPRQAGDVAYDGVQRQSRDGIWHGYGLVLAATVTWSTSGTFIRIILQRYSLAPWTVAVWRDTLTFFGLALLTLLVDRTQLLAPVRLPANRRGLPKLAVMGVISVGLFHVLWTQALALIPVAVATVLNYTAPAFVVLGSWLLWRERPTRRQTTALFLTLLGCLLVTEAYAVTKTQLDTVGLLLGLATGITYASYTLFSKAGVGTAPGQYGSWTIVTYAFGFAALSLWLVNPSAGLALLGAPWSAWLWMVVLALVSTAIGFAAYTSGLRFVSANSAGIISTVEPVLAAGLALVLLGEVVGIDQMLGGLLVIAAVALLTVRRGPFADGGQNLAPHGRQA
jgi:drug/metabolite transporter (DMT)-like permease